MTRDDEARILTAARSKLSAVREELSQVSTALTDASGVTALGHVASAMTKIERRLEELWRKT